MGQPLNMPLGSRNKTTELVKNEKLKNYYPICHILPIWVSFDYILSLIIVFLSYMFEKIGFCLEHISIQMKVKMQNKSNLGRFICKMGCYMHYKFKEA